MSEDNRIFPTALEGASDAIAHRDAVGAGTYRGPGFVVADEQGYDLELAKASVGRGWHAILERLFTGKPKLVRVEQVKEKFGGLRVYYSIRGMPVTEEDGRAVEVFELAVTRAEHESYRTCEECGAEGWCRPHGWLRTLCNPCDVEHHKHLDTNFPSGDTCRFSTYEP